MREAPSDMHFRAGNASYAIAYCPTDLTADVMAHLLGAGMPQSGAGSVAGIREGALQRLRQRGRRRTTPWFDRRNVGTAAIAAHIDPSGSAYTVIVTGCSLATTTTCSGPLADECAE